MTDGATPKITEDLAGWIVMNGDGSRYRTWKDGWSAWTDNRDEATRYARRKDAEAVHSEDEDAWTIAPFARALPADPDEPSAAMVEAGYAEWLRGNETSMDAFGRIYLAMRAARDAGCRDGGG